MHHDANMRTTIDINDALLAEVRRRSGESGRPFKEELDRLLRIGLAASENPIAKRPYKVNAHPLGLKAAFRGESLNQLFDQLEAEDHAR
jgi:hypothetical protein